MTSKKNVTINGMPIRRSAILTFMIVLFLLALCAGLYLYVMQESSFHKDLRSFVPAGVSFLAFSLLNLTWGLGASIVGALQNLLNSGLDPIIVLLFVSVVILIIAYIVALFLDRTGAAKIIEKALWTSFGIISGAKIGTNREKNKT